MDFLSSILYPKTAVWEVLLNPSNCFSERVQSQCILKIIHAVVSSYFSLRLMYLLYVDEILTFPFRMKAMFPL